MGQAAGVPSPDQRGHAAHIRQMDDNRFQNTGERMLPVEDRRFLNSIVHDPSMEHSPQYDNRLNNLRETHYPNNGARPDL
uniref:Uncharacterized protein n=1 Tax=Panagrolaimus sp. PS1159 TaxID=55785 RepID=A0AC35GUH3_9BILA